MFQVVQRWPFLPKISHFYISSKMAWSKYQILFILFQIVGRWCRNVELLMLSWIITVSAWKLFLFIFVSENYHILALRMRGISVKWRHYLRMTQCLYAKSNLNLFWHKPPCMEAISQTIRSVGLFVSSSPEVTISTKNQPFLYLLKNGLIEVPDFVYSFPNCWEMV